MADIGFPPLPHSEWLGQLWERAGERERVCEVMAPCHLDSQRQGLEPRSVPYCLGHFLSEYNCFTLLCWLLPCARGPLLSPEPPSRHRQAHQAGLPALFSSFLPTSYLTHSRVSVSTLTASPSHLPPLLCLCLYSCPANWFLCTSFLDSIDRC